MRLLPVSRFAQELPRMKALLAELVTSESPSTDKAAVDRLGQRIGAELRSLAEQQALKGEIQVFPQEQAGDHLLCRWGGTGSAGAIGNGEGTGGLLVLCHMDTVYELGTLARQPLHEEGGRIYGPGVMDMKGGIVMLLTALRLFQEEGLWPERPLTALFTSDEEVGSLTSRPLIEQVGRQAAAAFCLEPALANGAIKTARKGTGDIELQVKGVAAHAGIDHARGRNAIEELAHHILSAQALTDYPRGTTVNVGVVSGGTRGNVVPDEARALIDFRVTRMEEVARLEQWVKERAPVVEGTSVSAALTLNRPPMPRDETMARAFQQAQAAAGELGFELTEGLSGGGSDANFIAPLGIPVLDGLGGVGDGAHSQHEYVEVDSLPQRAALLAGLLLNWQ